MKNERFDLIQKNGYGIFQNQNWFSYGIDAVLISHFASVKNKQTVVDLGTGNGIIPLLLNINHPNANYYGIEKQKEVHELSLKSLEKNKLNNVKFIHSDIQHVFDHLGKSSAHVVISNPPYFSQGDALINEEDVKAHARHETTGNLEDFIRTASYLLMEKGHFYMVHRPMRLVDIFYYCRNYNLEPKLIQFVYPHQDKPPNIVLIRCIKNGNKELKYADNLYVYDDERNYTQDIYKIYSELGIDVF